MNLWQFRLNFPPTSELIVVFFVCVCVCVQKNIIYTHAPTLSASAPPEPDKGNINFRLNVLKSAGTRTKICEITIRFKI